MHNISARAFRAYLRGRTALIAMAAASFVARHAARTQAEFGVPTGHRYRRREQASYKQDAFGGQFGVDLGRMDADGGIVFGVTGGHLTSERTFRRSADRISYDVLNAGAYATFVKGRLFINALRKYDHIDTRARFSDRLVTGRPDLSVYGGQLELRLRFGTDRLFIEPLIGAAYVSRDR